MVWYITYIICNNWARDFMDTQVVGNINVALVFGLLQFVSTFRHRLPVRAVLDEEPGSAGHQAAG